MATKHMFSGFRPECIPPGIQRGLDNYQRHGIRPGDCLYAILCGDLYDAVSRADPETAANLAAIVCYIALKFDVSTWGSRENVDATIKRAALERLRPMEEA